VCAPHASSLPGAARTNRGLYDTGGQPHLPIRSGCVLSRDSDLPPTVAQRFISSSIFLFWYQQLQPDHVRDSALPLLL